MIKPVNTEKDYELALNRIEELWGAKEGTSKGDELDVLMVLIENYENNHYPMPPSDPVNAIKFLMEQYQLKRKDLEPYLGRKSRVSDILNRKRTLTIQQIINLHKGLKIPYECLLP